MAIKITTGSLNTSSGDTEAQVALSGQADYIYISVHAKTYGWLADDNSDTGITTGKGMTMSTNDVYPFRARQPVYFFHVATAAGPFTIMETW